MSMAVGGKPANLRSSVLVQTIETDAMKTVAVIGGGPAGLMAADVLSQSGIRVRLFEAKASVGRKFLIAGKGGLNLTHSEPFETFCSRYGPDPQSVLPWLRDFGPDDVRNWATRLGFETFIGFSKRVFPKDLKAAPLLQRWIERLQNAGVEFETQHRWQGWNTDTHLVFETPDGPTTVEADATVLTLGGASWPVTGSDGNWVSAISARGIDVVPFLPANCGFHVAWSDHFRERNAGEPLKSVGLSFAATDGTTFQRQGSCVVTENGLEGSLIYAASAMIRDEIIEHGSATITLDLAPDRDLEKLTERLSIPRGSRTVAKHLKSKANLKGVQTGLLREFAADTLNQPARLAEAIKALPIKLTGTRPLAEAISTAGGVRIDALDERLMTKAVPGLFCAGEMLDWEAPTGGYLLTACFASGQVAAKGVIEWMNQSEPSSLVVKL